MSPPRQAKCCWHCKLISRISNNRGMVIHYHVWFHFKPEVGEDAGLEIVHRFLTEMKERGVQNQLMKNRADAAKSKLDRYHAWFEFADQTQMNAVLGEKAREGIQVGAHGELIRAVSSFHVEVFDNIPNSP